MTAEEYLEQVKKIDAIILNKLKEYKRWVAVADGMGGFSVSDRVQTTRNLHRGADAIVEYIDLEREINELKRQKNEVIGTLQQLPYNEYIVLYKLYVDDYMLKELPDELYRSYDWCKKKKSNGLKLLQDILDEKRADH